MLLLSNPLLYALYAISISSCICMLYTTTDFVYQAESPDEGALVDAARDLG
jgi:hypothetical protein